MMVLLRSTITKQTTRCPAARGCRDMLVLKPERGNRPSSALIRSEALKAALQAATAGRGRGRR
jgi:hypothetical protein